MHRNRIFTHIRRPLPDGTRPRLLETTGPVDFLNPTQAEFQYTIVSNPDQKELGAGEALAGQSPVSLTRTICYKWTSRNNRKGRHAITFSARDGVHTNNISVNPKPVAHWRHVRHNLWLMLTCYPVWDISWCVAFIFTWGSALWVLNGLFVFLPFEHPEATFRNQVLVGGGVSAFIGATVFELGSILLFLEAVNATREACFGWALDQAYNQHFGKWQSTSSWQVAPDLDACTHHHYHNKRSLLDALSSGNGDEQDTGMVRTWSWLPS